MSEIVLFHHVLGLTEGVHDFAETLRQHGHIVQTPDLFDGETFNTIEQGMAFVEHHGFENIVRRGVDAAAEIPHRSNRRVYAGFSLGAAPAQTLMTQDPEALGGFLLHSFVSPDFLAGSWPLGMPVQVHAMKHDPFFTEDGDREAALEYQQRDSALELFSYPGDAHLFFEPSQPGYDSEATVLVTQRILELLDRL